MIIIIVDTIIEGTLNEVARINNSNIIIIHQFQKRRWDAPVDQYNYTSIYILPLAMNNNIIEQNCRHSNNV